LKILIVQPILAHYRVPLFEELAHKFDLTILYFGESSNFNKYGFKLINGTYVKIGPFKIIRNLVKLVSHYDIIICVFDFHWLNLFFLPLYFKKPIIFWGHGFGRNRFINLLRILMVFKSSALILYDSISLSKFTKYGINRDKIFIANNTLKVPNSFDYSGEAKNILIYVGRLQVRKGLDLLLFSFSLLHLQITCVLMGYNYRRTGLF
jgi:glycosyltransferase involved in cell wall biosynthesis